MPITISVLPLCLRPSEDWSLGLSSALADQELAQCRPPCKFQLLSAATDKQAIALLEQLDDATGDDRYILVSDAIVETLGHGAKRSLKPLEWVKELVAPSSRVVSLAVHDDVPRIVDIDRVLSPRSSVAQWCQALRQVTAKLLYLSRPLERLPAVAIDCRSLLRRSDLHAYFQLRHSVYSIMGYLERDVETCTSGLEIDSSDPHAIHFGAFASVPSGEVLAGTARVVLNRPAVAALAESLQQMASDDPVIRRRLANELPLQLPVFQSQKLSPVLTEILRKGVMCGELSRVIVAPEFRGAGISTLLVDCAIERARQQGLQRMFLECLPCHSPYYERMGFRVVPGLRGQVLGVQRTMGVMELDFTARPSRPR